VEIGAGLAAEARRNPAGFAGVEVVQAAFETWRPPRTAVFDLVFAATAWHWVDPTLKYRRAWELLQPGGHLAFWSAAHVFPAGGDPFFRDILDVYEEIGEGLPPGAAWPQPGELADDRAEIEASGLFGPVVVRQFDWEVSYTAEQYIRLLDTFSDHIAMDAWNGTGCTARSGTGWPGGPTGACGGTGAWFCTLPGVSPTLILHDDRSASSVPIACQNGQPSGVFNGHSRTVLIVASLARSRLRDCPRRPPKQ
jgi:Methyltransferase domain